MILTFEEKMFLSAAFSNSIKSDEPSTFDSGLCQKCGEALTAFGDCLNCGTMAFEQERVVVETRCIEKDSAFCQKNFGHDGLD